MKHAARRQSLSHERVAAWATVAAVAAATREPEQPAAASGVESSWGAWDPREAVLNRKALRLLVTNAAFALVVRLSPPPDDACDGRAWGPISGVWMSCRGWRHPGAECPAPGRHRLLTVGACTRGRCPGCSSSPKRARRAVRAQRTAPSAAASSRWRRYC